MDDEKDDSQPVEQVTETQAGGERKKAPEEPTGMAAVALGALGIVFGDIGTSPLYTLKTIFGDADNPTDPKVVLGILSLVVWTLIIITTIKYVSFAMRIDNDKEGGILALMSLIGIKRGHKPVIIAAGLFGAALLYGDGAITPAISVLSALEGLHQALPKIDPYILPLAVATLVVLFFAQPFGTAKIGKLFGPIMLIWFATIAGLGIWGIAQHPAVLVGLSPTYAINYLAHGGFTAYALLGGVFLCVTGAEALYADMGHFGRRPIWLGWFSAVFPALVLNYAGQIALVLNGVETNDNIFYKLCPPALLIPLIILATAATIIASQAIITGAYSMTRQAIQLGWMPRLIIRQTSDEGYGQIYIGAVNWLLMITTITLALAFKKSDNLSAAYGMAVSATMLLTTILLYKAMHEVWGWSVALAGAVAGFFMIVDLAFFGANLLKIHEGGWVPLVIGVAVFSLMRVWHRGVEAIGRYLHHAMEPLDEFFTRIEKEGVARVKGTAIFLSRARKTTPPLLTFHVKQNSSLYENVLIATISTELVPRVSRAERFDIKEELPNVWRAIVHYGFMERINLDEMLPELKRQGCKIDLSKVVYYLGHESVVRAKRGKRQMPMWMERLFALLERNQAHLTDVLGLPTERVVEIGRQVEL